MTNDGKFFFFFFFCFSDDEYPLPPDLFQALSSELEIPLFLGEDDTSVFDESPDEIMKDVIPDAPLQNYDDFGLNFSQLDNYSSFSALGNDNKRGTTFVFNLLI